MHSSLLCEPVWAPAHPNVFEPQPPSSAGGSGHPQQMRDVTPTHKETDTVRTKRRLEVFGSLFSRDTVRRVVAPHEPFDKFILPGISELRKISLTGESAIEPRALALL
ncbi:MAG: hypothetical protein U1A22_02020 [Xanthomonadaceae bacterium]|nr:hypothetical protein [Xanthomonadaceae bacterium]